jgi:hypothetical protein
MRRRSKRTIERQRLVCEAIAAGLSRQGAAADAGIARSTLYEWLDGDPAFRQELDAAEARYERRVVRRMEQAANRGSWAAEAWLAERRLPDRFRAKTEIELSGALSIDDPDIRIARELAAMSDEELVAMDRDATLGSLRRLLAADDPGVTAILEDFGYGRAGEPVPRLFGRRHVGAVN